MTKRPEDDLQIFVAPDGGGDGDGSAERPYASLDQALQTLANGKSQLSMPDVCDVEIIRLKPGVAKPRQKRPTYRYYVDTRAVVQGDGSELAPWNSLQIAAVELSQLAGTGQLQLRPGQRLRVIHREMFTATDVEKSKKRHEQFAKFIFLAMALICVAPVLATLGFLIVKAWPALSLDFLFTNPQDNLTAGGVWAPLIGTFFLVLISLIVAAPIGVLAGVYLNEYAGDNWFTRIVNLAVVNLAGVPSIVYALFGVGAFVHFAHMGRSLVAASCTVAVMTLPVIITSTREALAAVPTSFREACWNMGATRWQTIRTIVLPNSFAGILTGVILQVARAAGETAPILFTGVLLYVDIPESGWQAYFPYVPGDRFMALSYHLFALSTQVRGVSDQLLYGTAVVLVGLVLVVNSISIVLRVYLRSHKKW